MAQTVIARRGSGAQSPRGRRLGWRRRSGWPLVDSRRGQALGDGAVAVAAFAASLLMATHHTAEFHPGPAPLDGTSLSLLAAATVPLAWWRRAPRAVFVATTTMSVFLGLLGHSVGLLVGPTAALYLWASHRASDDPWARRDTALVISLFAVSTAASGVGDRTFPGIELFHSGLAFAVAWFAGERVRLRREHVADLEARAATADSDRERERRLALAEERARIARDLHDSVGHAINVIAVRAGGARLRYDQDPFAARAALEAIEDVARQTADDVDHIVGALRDSGDETQDPAPIGLASVPALVTHHAASGLEVAVATVGTVRPLDPSVDQAAYRIVQEALTNAARHGSGTAELEVAFGDVAVELVVTNAVAEGEQRGVAGGHGLLGMRERAALLGGTVKVERSGGVFRLCARLPRRSHQ